MRRSDVSVLRLLLVLASASCIAQLPGETDDAGGSAVETTPFASRAEPIPALATISDSAAYTLTYSADTAAADIDMLTASMSAVIDDGLYSLVSRGTQCAGAKGSAQPLWWYCFDPGDASSWKDPDVDLSYWQSTGQLWSVTEYIDHGRMIYSMLTNSSARQGQGYASSLPAGRIRLAPAARRDQHGDRAGPSSYVDHRGHPETNASPGSRVPRSLHRLLRTARSSVTSPHSSSGRSHAP